MKALLLSLALEGATLVAHAQGTIWFGNSTLTPISVRLLDGTQRLANAQDDLLIGAFYGPGGTIAGPFMVAPGLATIGPVDGVMINAPRVFPLPGTEPGEVISLQIRVWDAALGADGWQAARMNCAGRYYGETPVHMFFVAPTDGPGMPIWQSWQGLHPYRFYPLTVYACPEPSIVAIAVLAGLLLLVRRRN